MWKLSRLHCVSTKLIVSFTFFFLVNKTNYKYYFDSKQHIVCSGYQIHLIYEDIIYCIEKRNWSIVYWTKNYFILVRQSLFIKIKRDWRSSFCYFIWAYPHVCWWNPYPGFQASSYTEGKACTVDKTFPVFKAFTFTSLALHLLQWQLDCVREILLKRALLRVKQVIENEWLHWGPMTYEI